MLTVLLRETMKFMLKSTTDCGRLGLLTNIARLPGFEMETPHMFLLAPVSIPSPGLYKSSRGNIEHGTVPHITQDILQMVSSEELALHIPISTVTQLKDRMKLFNKSLADFIGMKGYLTYCTFFHPSEKRIRGFREKSEIPIWTKFGKELFSASSYMELIEDLKPDMFLMLADNDIDPDSPKKRLQKAMAANASILETSLKLFQKSDALKNSEMIGALEGGFDLTHREEASKLLGKSPVFGVVVDGLHDYSTNVAELNSALIKPLAEVSLKHIPNDKLRIIHGCWNPNTVLDLIELGIDIFDSSYPCFIAEECCALIFPNIETDFNSHDYSIVVDKKELLQEVQKTVITSNLEEMINDEPASKKPKIMPDSKYYISMLNPKFVTDFSPILKNCQCYTCKNHTRAYVHHLLNVRELSGLTLLIIHNLHHYLLFFSTIRETLKSGKFNKFKNKLKKWAEDKDFSLPC